MKFNYFVLIVDQSQFNLSETSWTVLLTIAKITFAQKASIMTKHKNGRVDNGHRTALQRQVGPESYK